MKVTPSLRTVPVLALFGVVGLLAACGTASTSAGSQSQISGGLAQGPAASSSNQDKSVAGTAGPATQPASNAVLQALGDQKVIQDATMGFRSSRGHSGTATTRPSSLPASSTATS